MTRTLLLGILLLSSVVLSVTPAQAQDATQTPTPFGDDDFAGGFEATLYGMVGALVVLAILALGVAEASTPDTSPDDHSEWR